MIRIALFLILAGLIVLLLRGRSARVQSPVRRLEQAEGVERLDLAWDILAARAERHRSRIAVARAGCARLTALDTGTILPPSALDALTSIRKGMPELVIAWLRHADSASAAEQSRSLDELVASVERTAARAEREADALAQGHADAFDLQRAHMDRRSGEDQDGFKL